jgi:hypothetical protein
METGSDKPPENDHAPRWMAGRRRHETIRRLIDRHGKLLAGVAIVMCDPVNVIAQLRENDIEPRTEFTVST